MFGLFFAGKASQVATAIVLTTTTGAVATGLVISDIEVPESTTTTAVVEEVEVPETTVTTQVVVAESNVEGEDVQDDEAEVGPVDDDGVPYGTVACDEAENHGEYVSGVAKDERVAEAEGPRGQIVSQAATTDCGKTDDDDDADEEEREDDESDDADRNNGKKDKDNESDDNDDADDADDNDDADEPRGNGNGNGSGSGNGNGNGNGNDK